MVEFPIIHSFSRFHLYSTEATHCTEVNLNGNMIGTTTPAFNWELANIFYKRQDCKFFVYDFVGQTGYVATTQLCHCSIKVAINNI